VRVTTLLDYTVAAEDYETRLARGELKGDAFREAVEALSRLTSVRRRRDPPITIAAVPSWAHETVISVCEAHRITVDQLVGQRRHRAFVQARHEAAARLRQLGRSFPEIGRALGGRDHTTIMYAVASYEAAAGKAAA